MLIQFLLHTSVVGTFLWIWNKSAQNKACESVQESKRYICPKKNNPDFKKSPRRRSVIRCFHTGIWFRVSRAQFLRTNTSIKKYTHVLEVTLHPNENEHLPMRMYSRFLNNKSVDWFWTIMLCCLFCGKVMFKKSSGYKGKYFV